MANQIQDAHSRGGIANAEQGLVILDGPDGVAVTLTAEAAEETAASLSAAAQLVLSQRPKPKSS
jgi:hypothetical protein